MRSPLSEQSTVIVRALGLDGPEVSHSSRMRAVAATVEAIVTQMRRAVQAGTLPACKIREFRDGEYPSATQLAKKVHEIREKADAAVPR